MYKSKHSPFSIKKNLKEIIEIRNIKVSEHLIKLFEWKVLKKGGIGRARARYFDDIMMVIIP